MPLPPYIEREDDDVDESRYQTVYGRVPGAIAAPTAGLHFTEDVLASLDAKGVHRTALTLHVGIGTFRPIEVDDPAEHEMHRESFVVSPEAAETINAASGRVWAVGTTTVRTLESAARIDFAPGWHETDLFITPGFEFRVVDTLLTNFHLPRSSLLLLVAALGGMENVHRAYLDAVRERYRFYSFGDCMLLHRARL